MNFLPLSLVLFAAALAQAPTTTSSGATIATEAEEVRGLDLGTWALLLLVIFLVVLSWRAALRWADDHLEPTLQEVRHATASFRPPRLVPILPPQPTPALLGESWLRPGSLHLVLSDDPGCMARLARELLEVDHVAVGISSSRLGPDALAGVLPASAATRAFWTPDPVNEAVLAAVAVRGRPAVVLLDELPTEDLVAMLARWGAIGVLVRPEDPGMAGTISWRRAS